MSDQTHTNAHLEALRQQRNIAFDQAAMLAGFIAVLQESVRSLSEQNAAWEAKARAYGDELASKDEALLSLRVELESLRELLPTVSPTEPAPSFYDQNDRGSSMLRAVP